MQLSLYLIKPRHMETCGSGSTAPRILNGGARWIWVVASRRDRLNSEENGHAIHRIRGWVGPKVHLDAVPLSGIEPRFLGRPVSDLVTDWTAWLLGKKRKKEWKTEREERLNLVFQQRWLNISVLLTYAVLSGREASPTFRKKVVTPLQSLLAV
jgi:hypothetical protein